MTLASSSTNPSFFNSKLKFDLKRLKQSPFVSPSSFKLRLNKADSKVSFGKKGELKRIPWLAGFSLEIVSISLLFCLLANEAIEIALNSNLSENEFLSSREILISSTLYNSFSNLKKFWLFCTIESNRRSNLISVFTLI